MPPERRPNIVLLLADDLGFSDIGCYGSEIRTPELDALAQNGVRMSQFYNTARCSPSRASLLTGLHPHQTGIGVLTRADGPGGYAGVLNDRCATMAEILSAAGYGTYMAGKWHLTGKIHEPSAAWPTRRGFDRFYGIIAGAASYYDPATLTRDETPIRDVDGDYYLTSALAGEATTFIEDHFSQRPDDPFFLYVPFTAPHWPLHAPPEIVDTYRGVFDEGWDSLRERRYRRLIDLGLMDGSWELSDRDADVPTWSQTADQAWQARRMEVYAAQVELMDAAIGTIVAGVDQFGAMEDTMIIFLSDNGGCAEEISLGWVDELPTVPVHTPTHTLGGERVRRGNSPSVLPGPPDTYASYGKPWANVSNAPFRKYKHWVHEGGIATPLLVHWPAGLPGGEICHTPHQLPDVLATVLDATGVDYPNEVNGREVLPIEGTSMIPSWHADPTDRTLFWEHEGNAAIRRGRWKLVRKYGQPWELYDIEADRTELHDRAAEHFELVADMAADYEQWAKRCGVLPREEVLATATGTEEGLVRAGYLSATLR